MRYLVTVLSAWIIVVTIALVYTEARVTNLERQLVRVERGYNEVLEANEQLERINNQNLRLISEGGWDAMVGDDTTY